MILKGLGLIRKRRFLVRTAIIMVVCAYRKGFIRSFVHATLGQICDRILAVFSFFFSTLCHLRWDSWFVISKFVYYLKCLLRSNLLLTVLVTKRLTLSHRPRSLKRVSPASGRAPNTPYFPNAPGFSYCACGVETWCHMQVRNSQLIAIPVMTSTTMLKPWETFFTPNPTPSR